MCVAGVDRWLYVCCRVNRYCSCVNDERGAVKKSTYCKRGEMMQENVIEGR